MSLALSHSAELASGSSQHRAYRKDRRSAAAQWDHVSYAIFRRSLPLAAASAFINLVNASRAAAQVDGPGGGINGPGLGGGGGGDSASNSKALSFFRSNSETSKEPVVLTLASFAVTKLAYMRLTKRFREGYLHDTGIDVRFRLTFAGSGVQARAVIDGLPADIVALALVLDVQKIAQAGLTDLGWQKRNPNNSIVCETTVAFVVRNGNPKNILTWDDLVREDVEVVVANPKTAGVARWIFLALWGHKMKKGTDEASVDYVTKVFERVVVQPRDAREASDVFYKQKVGDVLLTYENEVVLTNQIYGDKALPYLVPKKNIRIECPVSLVDRVLEQKGPLASKAAEDFLKFLFTPDAQKEFAKVGFRVNPKLAKQVADTQGDLPPSQLWSVDKELGGWDAAMDKFFSPSGILDTIQAEVGLRKQEARRAGKK